MSKQEDKDKEREQREQEEQEVLDTILYIQSTTI